MQRHMTVLLLNYGDQTTSTNNYWDSSTFFPFFFLILNLSRFRIHPSAFFQVNTKATEILYDIVRRWCGDLDKTVNVLVCWVDSYHVSLPLRIFVVEQERLGWQWHLESLKWLVLKLLIVLLKMRNSMQIWIMLRISFKCDIENWFFLVIALFWLEKLKNFLKMQFLPLMINMHQSLLFLILHELVFVSYSKAFFFFNFNYYFL